MPARSEASSGETRSRRASISMTSLAHSTSFGSPAGPALRTRYSARRRTASRCSELPVLAFRRVRRSSCAAAVCSGLPAASRSPGSGAFAAPSRCDAAPAAASAEPAPASDAGARPPALSVVPVERSRNAASMASSRRASPRASATPPVLCARSMRSSRARISETCSRETPGSGAAAHVVTHATPAASGTTAAITSRGCCRRATHTLVRRARSAAEVIEQA